MIPYGRQDIRDEDVEAVVDVLRSEYLTQGPVPQRFEEALSAFVGSAHAVSVNSATSALHVACLSLGLGPGDILWTVPNTFVASANCGRYCGAAVDFVDIDPHTWNLSVSSLRDKLNAARASNRLPKILVAVHFAGQPTDQEEIWKLAQEFGFRIIEDASHAIGAQRHGERVGNCRWSDISIFSFHPVKIVTSGEGGVATTNDAKLAASMRLLRSHGITRDSSLLHKPALFIGDSAPGWYYEQQGLGFNYRMTDIQAALGLSQLARVDEYVTRRNELARHYQSALAHLPIELPTIRPENTSAFHLYVVRFFGKMAGAKRQEVYDAMKGESIGVNVHYSPVHLQPYYRQLGFGEGHCPEAERYGQTALTIPLFPTMTTTDQEHVITTLTKAVGTS